MGLDMYAYSVKAENAIDDFTISKDEDGCYKETNDIAYWRKFNALHGWMENLYRVKGGTKESFNCVPVRLTGEDLDNLEKDLKENKLTPTAGFFFGDQTIYPEDIAATKKFISDARDAMKDGSVVYYDSWW